MSRKRKLVVSRIRNEARGSMWKYRPERTTILNQFGFNIVVARVFELATVDRNLVDPASSHILVSKIKPCMSQYKSLYGETANGSLKQL